MFAELRRRNVLRAAAFYAASAWLLVQVATQVFPFFHIAEWVVRWIVVAAAIGFPFWILFSWFYEWTPQGLQRESEVPPEESVTRETGKKLDRWIIAILGLAVVLLLADKLVLRKTGDEPAAVPEKSIAVLPFVDLSQGKDQEYFCDGMSEELIGVLSRIPGLRVVARTSSFSFKGKNADVSESARKLGVASVLEGSLRRDGDRVRVTAQLINGQDGFHLWSQTFERELQGVFAVQDEITHAIVDALKLKLAGTTPAIAIKNTEGYDLYLQGLYYFNKSDEESYRKTLTLFEQALDKDPTLSRAWSGIAAVWNYLADVYVRPLEGYPASREAALKALAIDPRNAQALCYLADANRTLHWDKKGADAQVREAIKIDPNYGEAHLFLGTSLIDQGEREAGSAELRRAVKLDPLSASTHHFVANQLTRAGMLDEALVEAKRTNELDPTYFYDSSNLGRIYLAKGDVDEAIKFYEEGERMTQRPSAGLAIAYARIGRQADAERKLEELLQRARQTYYRADQIATVYAALGQTDTALEWLERAYSEHSSSLTGIGVRSEFRPLRQDPRFVDLVKRIGLDPAKLFRD